MRTPRILALLAAVLLFAAACGDDGDASPFAPGAEAGGGGGDGGGELPPGIPEEAAELLEGLQDGELPTGEDLEESLGDLMESAEEMAESFADDGTGTATVNGETIQISSEVCFVFGDDISFEGQGTTGDGTPVWVSISNSITSRAEMAQFLDEALLDQIYGDADPIEEASFSATFGQDGMFGSGPADQPDYDAQTGAGFGSIQIEVSGDSARGSGQATDFSNVVGDFDDLFDFSFEIACG